MATERLREVRRRWNELAIESGRPEMSVAVEDADEPPPPVLTRAECLDRLREASERLSSARSEAARAEILATADTWLDCLLELREADERAHRRRTGATT